MDSKAVGKGEADRQAARQNFTKMRKLWIAVLLVTPVLVCAQVAPAWRPFLDVKPDEARPLVLKAIAKT